MLLSPKHHSNWLMSATFFREYEGFSRESPLEKNFKCGLKFSWNLIQAICKSLSNKSSKMRETFGVHMVTLHTFSSVHMNVGKCSESGPGDNWSNGPMPLQRNALPSGDVSTNHHSKIFRFKNVDDVKIRRAMKRLKPSNGFGRR